MCFAFSRNDTKKGVNGGNGYILKELEIINKCNSSVNTNKKNTLDLQVSNEIFNSNDKHNNISYNTKKFLFSGGQNNDILTWDLETV